MDEDGRRTSTEGLRETRARSSDTEGNPIRKSATLTKKSHQASEKVVRKKRPERAGTKKKKLRESDYDIFTN